MVTTKSRAEYATAQGGAGIKHYRDAAIPDGYLDRLIAHLGRRKAACSCQLTRRDLGEQIASLTLLRDTGSAEPFVARTRSQLGLPGMGRAA